MRFPSVEDLRDLGGPQDTFVAAFRDPRTGVDELGTVIPLHNGWFAAVTQSQAEAFAGLNRTMVTLFSVRCRSKALI